MCFAVYQMPIYVYWLWGSNTIYQSLIQSKPQENTSSKVLYLDYAITECHPISL